MNSLKDKIVVVTGGTSGIGESCVKQFAQAGGKVIFAGRNRERGTCLEGELINGGFEAKYLYLDISKEQDVQRFVSEAYGWKNRIDALFNNAGIFPITPRLEEMPLDSWNHIFDVNAGGLFLITKHIIKYLIQSNGVILNNASVAGLQSFSSGKSYAYCGSKAAVIQFSNLLAKNYGRQIRVNCICPGVIDTPIFINRDFSGYEEIIPMGRIGQPEEVAKVANFLLSEDASYVNGAAVTIDGGQSI